MAGKKFKFRADGNRRVGIKESVVRNMSVRGPRVSVSVGLDNELNLSKRHHVENNILSPYSGKVTKRGKGCKAVYYPLDAISYIATLTFQYNKLNKIVEKTLIVYVPNNLCSEDEIYCRRVTSAISKEKQDEIISNINAYAMTRI